MTQSQMIPHPVIIISTPDLFLRLELVLLALDSSTKSEVWIVDWNIKFLNLGSILFQLEEFFHFCVMKEEYSK